MIIYFYKTIKRSIHATTDFNDLFLLIHFSIFLYKNFMIFSL